MNYESSIFIKYDEDNFQKLKALIIGPKDTPYENGCFIFDIFIPNNYPNVVPKFNLQTTGKGSVRFNPNLYKSGKVCLSLLGTWSGDQGESWNSETSTLLQVFVSIMALIMVENPYFNEPGYERDIGTERGNKRNFDYNDRVRLNNMKWAMLYNIKNPEPCFKDAILKHFYAKKDKIIENAEKWSNETNLSKLDYKNCVDELKVELNKLNENSWN